MTVILSTARTFLLSFLVSSCPIPATEALRLAPADDEEDEEDEASAVLVGRLTLSYPCASVRTIRLQ